MHSYQSTQLSLHKPVKYIFFAALVTLPNMIG